MIKQLFGIVEVKVEEDYDTYVKQKDLNSQLNKKWLDYFWILREIIITIFIKKHWLFSFT